MNARKVKLNISSVIENLDSSGLVCGDAERDLIKTAGDFFFSPDESKISYTEEREGARVECDILVNDSEISVERRGSIECLMRFSVGKSYKTLYKVSPFTFDMTTELIRRNACLSENGGTLTILYKMNVGGADKKVKMTITLEADNDLK